MNSLKNPLAIVGLVVIAIALGVIITLMGDGGPGSSTVKTLVENQMHARFKGSVIKNILLVRGGMFSRQGHNDEVKYGAPIYPIQVHVFYTRPSKKKNGPQEFTKSYFFYQTPTHQWAIDASID